MFKLLDCCGLFKKNNQVVQPRNGTDFTRGVPTIEIERPQTPNASTRVMPITGIRGEYFSVGSTFMCANFGLQVDSRDVKSSPQNIGIRHLDVNRDKEANEAIKRMSSFVSMKLGM